MQSIKKKKADIWQLERQGSRQLSSVLTMQEYNENMKTLSQLKKEIRIYILDVLAEDEEQARKIADSKYNDGMYTNYDMGDEIVETGKVFDVTNTDDPFNP